MTVNALTKNWTLRVIVTCNVVVLYYLFMFSSSLQKVTTIETSERTINDNNANEHLSRNLDSGAAGVTSVTRRKLGNNKLFPCDDYTPRSYYGQRGNYWVLYNYFTATQSFRCDESITYSTHADWTFLDNLKPLLERWQGPLSIALYSPGADFDDAIKRIQYIRECDVTSLVKDLVTFHIFFDQSHVPEIYHNPNHHPVNCSGLAESLSFSKGILTYKNKQNLTYPVNVARNVARDMATTYYVFPSDIELYPSPNLIPNFLDMIRQNDTMLQRPARKVFVLSIFEVEANVTALPYDKKELMDMLQNKSAVPFHKYICPNCHRIPLADKWLRAPIQPGLKIFHIAKRYNPYHHWEPIFIGTKLDPIYDERLSWEGRKDKMPHGYVLCLLDYEFHILDNAFLVHRPGIKRSSNSSNTSSLVTRQSELISKTILPELTKIYSTRPGCSI